MSDNVSALIDLLAYAYLQNGMPERAEVLYAILHLLRPGEAGPAKGLAWAALECDRPQVALSALDTVAAPGEPGALVQLLRARAFSRLGRSDDARVAMASFLSLRGPVRGLR